MRDEQKKSTRNESRVDAVPTLYSRDELKEKIAQIDTTYNLGDKMTTEFLIPNFYMDRLVDFITTYTEKECNLAVEEAITDYTRFLEYENYVDSDVWAEEPTAPRRYLNQLKDKSNELKKGIK
jgi:hypothetical protein